MKKYSQNRRDFLKSSAYAGASISALTASQFALINNALAQSPAVFNDYKALVCVFLYGGNDGYNMFAPVEPGVARNVYEKTRVRLSRDINTLISPVVNNMLAATGGEKLGMVPELAKLSSLFHDDKVLAVQANVGTLIKPTTLQEYKNRTATLPRQLFSHNSQQDTWQRGAEPHQGGVGATGWAGRLVDKLSINANENFMHSISFAGKNTWQSGVSISPFVARPGGADNLSLFHKFADIRADVVKDNYFSKYSPTHALQKEYLHAFLSAEKNITGLNAQLNDSSETLSLQFPDTPLGAQLRDVAMLIKIHSKLAAQNDPRAARRQVFFVGMGGWDTHNNQLENHPLRLQVLDDALAAFYTETKADPNHDFSNMVTSFTMSDFGRTMTPNAGDGTDHGWASHQFILGGAVKGGKVYGTLPSFDPANINSWSNYDVGGGRMLPTTASESMFDSLAQWFGMSDLSDRQAIFLNLDKFSTNPVNYFI